jgi:hypothetical protein
VALLGDSGPIAITTMDAKNDPATAEGPYISPVYWGADFRQAAQARLGDAYHLGSLQVIPRVDNKYKADENITYGAYVVRPSLDDKQQPQIELQIGLYAGGKMQDQQPYVAITGAKVLGEFWVFGQVLPLSGFRRGTEFELEVSLRDAKTGVTRAQKIPFTVIKEAPAPPAAAPTAVPKG